MCEQQSSKGPVYWVEHPSMGVVSIGCGFASKDPRNPENTGFYCRRFVGDRPHYTTRLYDTYAEALEWGKCDLQSDLNAIAYRIMCLEAALNEWVSALDAMDAPKPEPKTD